MKFLRSTTTLPLLLLLSGTQQHVTALDLPKYTDMDTAKLFVGNFNRETKGVSSFTLQFPPACGETHIVVRRETLIGVSGCLACKCRRATTPRSSAGPTSCSSRTSTATSGASPCSSSCTARSCLATATVRYVSFPFLSFLPFYPPSRSPFSLLPAFLPLFPFPFVLFLPPRCLDTRRIRAIEVESQNTLRRGHCVKPKFRLADDELVPPARHSALPEAAAATTPTPRPPRQTASKVRMRCAPGAQRPVDFEWKPYLTIVVERWGEGG